MFTVQPLRPKVTALSAGNGRLMASMTIVPSGMRVNPLMTTTSTTVHGY